MSDETKNNLRIEYEQTNETIRQYNSIGWTIGAIFLPVSIGLIAFSFTIENITWYGLLVLAISSILTYTSWSLFVCRFRWYNEILFKRIREIEKILGMCLHTTIHELDNKQDKKPIKALTLIKSGVPILILLWVLRIFFFLYIKSDP